MDDLKAILELMFDPEDGCCPATDQYAYHSMPISSVLSGEVTLMSPNPDVGIRKVKTEELTLLAINSIQGFRNDSNVQKYRTFLWEIDVGDISQQYKYARSLGIPTSACIWSGNKSLHFLTVLSDPIPLRAYRLFANWAMNIGTLFDKNCKNPSRMVRIPGAIRPDTGNRQRLVEIGGRISVSDFLAWLKTHPESEPKEYERKPLTGEPDGSKLSPWAKSQFKNGIDFSQGRNKTFFALACDMYSSGCDEEMTIDTLSRYFTEAHDFKEKEFLSAIASAYKYMANKG